jgi:uncharacterized membrane protein
MRPALNSALQLVDILVISLVAGSIFGIWRGYNPSTYSAETFVEVHQGAVRGLNVLLPVMGLTAIVLTLLLMFLSRSKARPFRLYFAALLAMVAAGLVTRLFNQPINAEVMGWTADAIPDNWTEFRDAWWRWHIVRLICAVAAAAILIAAVFADRDGVKKT